MMATGIALPLADVDTALAAPRARAVCTDCGISRTRWESQCASSCQFSAPRYEELERRAHGRSRDAHREDELHFGPYVRMLRARLRHPLAGARWTGITTRLGELLLEAELVDAVIATASRAEDRWAPRPVLVTRAEELQQCRGMKMGFSPVLALLERAVAAGYRRLAIVGVPCQIHALRALERELGLERLYVIGTPCSDNTTTAHFHQFLDLLSDNPAEVEYLEFMPDMRVEVRHRDGRLQRTPIDQLPLSSLPSDFFPSGCRTCFDFTNALADVTIGSMSGSNDQWLIVRNARGLELLALLSDDLEIAPLASRGRRRGAVKSFMASLERTSRGERQRASLAWARPLIDWLDSTFGPKGLEFARTRVEMKAVEGILTMGRERPDGLRSGVPPFAWTLVAPYGIVPAAEQVETERNA